MDIDLLDLISSFDVVDDRENEIAFFRTHVPWVGSHAYLHTVYKAITEDVLSVCARKLDIPNPVLKFLRRQNGADLFSGALYIYGVVRSGQLLNRSDPFSLPPFSIENANAEALGFDLTRFLAVGGYGFDGSQVRIDRNDLSIKAFPRKSDTPTALWPDFDHWLFSEITRLSALFDRSGKRLIDGSATLPPKANTIQ
jgi:hypothetical protein